MGYEAYSGITNAIGKYLARVGAMKCVVLHWEEHKVDYAKGSLVIMRRSQQNKNRSSGSKVFCQAVKPKMAAKSAVVRVDWCYEAGIYQLHATNGCLAQILVYMWYGVQTGRWNVQTLHMIRKPPEIGWLAGDRINIFYWTGTQCACERSH